MNEEFLAQWKQIMLYAAEVLAVASVIIFILYFLVLASKRKLSKKHEFMSSNEIRILWYSGLSLSLGVTFFMDYLIEYYFYTSATMELIFKFLSVAGLGFLMAYSIKTYLNVYYPFILEKRLHRIRFKKRISPDGNEMVLLDEESEDVHLTAEMIEHERINSFEYDVWMDEKSGYKIIEQYSGGLALEICDECNYRTAHETNEEMVTTPSLYEPGLLRKEYKCFYCGHEQRVEARIAPLRGSVEA